MKHIFDDTCTSIEELTSHIINYRRRYKLDKKDSVEELIKAINVESGELLNEILFNDVHVIEGDEDEAKSTEIIYDDFKIYRELADVLIYCIALADYMDRDITRLILEKIRYNKSRGRTYE